MGSHQGDGDHGPGALGNGSQPRYVGSTEFLEANPIDLGNFPGVRLQLDLGPGPDHDRCDDEARAGRVVVENSENRDRGEFGPSPDMLAPSGDQAVFGKFLKHLLQENALVAFQIEGAGNLPLADFRG